MSHDINTLNRLVPSLYTTSAESLLPEYYAEDYPKVISFLEEYYNFLDSTEQFNFVEIINDAILSRDTKSVDVKYLDQIIDEIGDDINRGSFNTNPRLMASLLPKFYQAKGTRVGTENFFRAFYGEEVEIEYPKKNIFIVGEDKIGYEAIKFLQDNRQYQVFSVLLRLGLNVVDYEDLYKKLAHPAGFYFLGVIQTQTQLGIALTTDTVDWEDSAENFQRIIIDADTPLNIQMEYSDLTAIVDSAVTGKQHRATLLEANSEYQNITLADLQNFYGTIDVWYDANSFTFDDSSAKPRPDMSMTFETMDNDWYTRIGSDSAY